MIKKLFTDYFLFSRSEKRGIFVLLCVILLVILFNLFLPYIIPGPSVSKEQISQAEAFFNNQKNNNFHSKVINDALFQFNPNTVTKQELILLGLTDKKAETFINYRNSGGKFYKKEDFKKVYSIDSNTYKRLENYIYFDSQKTTTYNTIQNKSIVENFNSKEEKHKFFFFNPNTATLNDFLNLGFSHKQAESIINYRAKSNGFKTKEDFKKLYVVSNEKYTELEPYIQMPNMNTDSVKKVQKEYKSYKDESIKPFNINTASIEKFKQIRGIGEKISARIVKFRDQLGGFYSKEQLLTVYGIEKELYEANKHLFLVNPEEVTKININTITIEEFYKHPLVSFNDARKIVNYRKMHGLFTNVNEIKSNDLVDDNIYSKIVNYLTIQ